MFTARVRKEVIKKAKKLPKAHRVNLANFLEILKNKPVPVDEFDVKQIKGRKNRSRGRYRLRLGDYRVTMFTGTRGL